MPASRGGYLLRLRLLSGPHLVRPPSSFPRAVRLGFQKAFDSPRSHGSSFESRLYAPGARWRIRRNPWSRFMTSRSCSTRAPTFPAWRPTLATCSGRSSGTRGRAQEVPDIAQGVLVFALSCARSPLFNLRGSPAAQATLRWKGPVAILVVPSGRAAWGLSLSHVCDAAAPGRSVPGAIRLCSLRVACAGPLSLDEILGIGG